MSRPGDVFYTFLRPPIASRLKACRRSSANVVREAVPGNRCLPRGAKPVSSATVQGYHIDHGLSNRNVSFQSPHCCPHSTCLRHSGRLPVRSTTRAEFTTALQGCQIQDTGLRNRRYMALRPSKARASVTSSVYSRSPPTGRPRASRVTLAPNWRSC